MDILAGKAQENGNETAFMYYFFGVPVCGWHMLPCFHVSADWLDTFSLQTIHFESGIAFDTLVGFWEDEIGR